MNSALQTPPDKSFGQRSKAGASARTIFRVQGGKMRSAEDVLAIEEPLEIRLEYGPRRARQKKSISITMRTPGHDFELAAGFLFTEGIIRERGQINEISHCGPPLTAGGTTNVVRVGLHPDVCLNLKSLERHFYTSSSCGVCGKSSIAALKIPSHYQIDKNPVLISSAVIHQIADRLRSSQAVFDSTGGLHATGLFSIAGELLLSREDVGRHNAMDKIIGRALLDDRLPLSQSLLLVSGRASFELVQKASMAAVPVLAAVGAPSSLAVDLASQTEMTLIGFVRDGRFNIYNGEFRIQCVDSVAERSQ